MLKAVKNFEDLQKWRALLRELYQDLEAVYSNEKLNDSEKRRQKEALFASMSERVVVAQFQNPDRFQRAVEKGTWNNARMVQYKTYNHNRDYFRAVYEQEDRDLLRFMRAIETITDGQNDPFKALKAAALKGSK